MLRILFLKTVVKLIAWPTRRRLRAFDRATLEPQRHQEELLREIIARQAETQKT